MFSTCEPPSVVSVFTPRHNDVTFLCSFAYHVFHLGYWNGKPLPSDFLSNNLGTQIHMPGKHCQENIDKFIILLSELFKLVSG